MDQADSIAFWVKFCRTHGIRRFRIDGIEFELDATAVVALDLPEEEKSPEEEKPVLESRDPRTGLTPSEAKDWFEA